MTSWYSLDIENGDKAKNKMQRIMDSFMPKYIGSGRPLGMAIFYSQDQQSNNVTVYFSPKAASFALQYGAMPYGNIFVDKELQLLVGDGGSIDYLFPDVDA